jgi:hypothetical protein
MEASWFKEVFLDSDTKVAMISGAPSEDPRDWFLTNDMKFDARKRVNDAAGTRRVPRIRMRRGIDVQVDGATASLIDLSTMGAQVVSTTVLKPRQRVRVVLAVDPYLIRAAGTVAWALFEIPKGGMPPQYRAGLEFSSADPEPLLQFCIEQAAEASAS